MSGIEVDEILQAQARHGTRKRPHPPEENGNDENGAIPRQRIETMFSLASGDVEKNALLEALEEAAEAEMVDEGAVRRLVNTLEKRVVQNQELRIKYADHPVKFMDSEVELNMAIQEMNCISTVPSLYFLLTELNAVQTLLELLMHPNADISIAVVNLFQELTDLETLVDSEDDVKPLVEALLEFNVISLLVQNMERLDESAKDEADGMQKSLGVVENLIEFKPEVAKMCGEQGLLAFLLKRLRAKLPFDANKLYCSEILSILLQEDDSCKKALGELDGIDILLSQLAAYKRHNPTSEAEIEMMENLFNCLCACLLFVPNRSKFLRGEGLQLMNLMLREKKMSRASALKVLNYATMGKEGKDNCDKFVEILGLRTLFPLFMKTPSKTRRKGYSAEAHEEHAVGIIASLLKHCGSSQRSRVMAKFAEADFAKVERLIELHFKYTDRVREFERQFMEENRSTEDLEEQDLYMQKLDAGLFTLQMVDYCIAVVYTATTSNTLTQRLTKMLAMRGSGIKAIEVVLKDELEFLGESSSEEKQILTHVLEKLAKDRR